jgi:DNA repair protein RecO (recombination protein O)
MNERLRGIVLQQHKYSETSLVVKVYTEAHGLQSYLIKGAYGRHSKLRPAFFQPMTFIDFIADIKSKRDLQYMSEIAIETVFYSIPFDMQKNAIILFISELLSKTILEHEANPPLFDFLHRSIQWLDLCQGSFTNFHLFFCFELTRYLGFYPKLERLESQGIFDLMEGQFKSNAPSHGYYIEPPVSLKIRQLCLCRLENLNEIELSNALRREILLEIITYYRLHLPGFNGLKSHEVLKSVFD